MQLITSLDQPMAKGPSDDTVHPEPVGVGDEDARYRLSPELFPRGLQLQLSDEALRALQALSARTGRSISEIAEELISRGLDPPPPRGE